MQKACNPPKKACAERRARWTLGPIRARRAAMTGLRTEGSSTAVTRPQSIVAQHEPRMARDKRNLGHRIPVTRPPWKDRFLLAQSTLCLRKQNSYPLSFRTRLALVVGCRCLDLLILDRLTVLVPCQKKLTTAEFFLIIGPIRSNNAIVSTIINSTGEERCDGRRTVTLAVKRVGIRPSSTVF